MENISMGGLTVYQRVIKRLFDISVSAIGIILIGWLIVLAALLARFDTGNSGIFCQERVGRFGKTFSLLKVRTMRNIKGFNSVVTIENDPRITRIGRILRKTKVDELPQLINTLLGHMSLVGPRPDLPEYMNRLTGQDRLILSVRPGITGPATLKYRDEERVLACQNDPERYNDEVIFPDKVAINREYVEHYSFMNDLRILWQTIYSGH